MATNITFHPGTSISRDPSARLCRARLRAAGAVTYEERAGILKQKGATIWLTGLSASGKVGLSLGLGLGPCLASDNRMATVGMCQHADVGSVVNHRDRVGAAPPSQGTARV
jgi:hypothetical protein